MMTRLLALGLFTLPISILVGSQHVQAEARGKLNAAGLTTSRVIDSPLKPAPASVVSEAGVLRPEAMPLRVDSDLFKKLNNSKQTGGMILEKVPLSPGLQVDLDLKPLEVRTTDARFVLMERGPDGRIRERVLEMPTNTLWTGHVVGEPESQAFIGISEKGCQGFIESHDGLHVIASPNKGNGPVAVYRAGADIGDLPLTMSDFQCHIEELRGQPHGPQLADDHGYLQVKRVPLKTVDTDDRATARIPGNGEGSRDDGGSGDHRSGSDDGDDEVPPDSYPGACCFGSIGTGDDLGQCMDSIDGVPSTIWDCENLGGIFMGYNSTCADGDQTCNNEPLDCFRVRVAIDTDVEFLNVFGGDVEAALNYIHVLMGASSQIYERDMSVRLQVAWIRLWSSETDGIDITDDYQIWNSDIEPWTATNTSTQISQFRQYWNSVEAPPVARDLMHMLSGRHLGGGIAYTSQVCTSSGYAVSAGLGGQFPYPIVNGYWNNWDLIVFAHELGHNLGTLHTHDYVYNSNGSLIDSCAYDCNFALNYEPTIMSYCHLCNGGIANISMKFHPFTKGKIYNHLRDLSCAWNQASGDLLAINDLDSTYPGLPVYVDVLSNDRGYICDNDNVTIEAESLVTTSILGGEIELVEYSPDDSDPWEHLLYTSPCGFNGLDSFEYTLLSTNPDAPDDANSNATVRVKIIAPSADPNAYKVELDGIQSYGLTGDSANENRTISVPVSARIRAVGWDFAEFDPSASPVPDARFRVKLEDQDGNSQVLTVDPYVSTVFAQGNKTCGGIVLDDEPDEFWFAPDDGGVFVEFHEVTDDNPGASDGSWLTGTLYVVVDAVYTAEGACCLGELCTAVESAIDCDSQGGVFQGTGTICTPQTCVQQSVATGACCIELAEIEGPLCSIATEVSCLDLAGTYLGDESQCLEQTCDSSATPEGACCITLVGESDPVCSISTADECTASEGEYQGDDIVCDDVICLPDDPSGACCLPTGQCLSGPQSLCDNAEGSFVGPGTDCEDIDCDVLTGACCLDGFCVELEEDDCNSVEGEFEGSGTSCATSCIVVPEGAIERGGSEK